MAKLTEKVYLAVTFSKIPLHTEKVKRAGNFDHDAFDRKTPTKNYREA